MFDLARDIIGTQPILAVFLAIGVGYLVGQINLGGFSLGVGAVLFVGLAIGAFAPKAQIVGPIGLTGLIMFLYGIGILYGRQFFEGMAGAAGSKYNFLALVAVIAGPGRGARAWANFRHQDRPYARHLRRLDDQHRHAAGRAGVMKNSEPSIGYSIAYPFGVIGPILCIYFMTRQVQPKFPAQGAAVSHGRDHAGRQLRRPHARRRTQGSADRRPGDDGPQGQTRTSFPPAISCLASGDGLMIVAERKEAIAEAAAKLGRLEPGRIVKDRSALDYIRVFVGKASMVGVPLAQLPMPAGFPTHLLHVRRYDMDIVPTPDLMLEFGDRVGVLMPPDRKEEIRRHFGDTVKATAEFSYVSLGLGMVMGVLLGLIPIPIPGVGTVTLGIGGGPLIVALILGKLRRTGPCSG